MLRTISALLSQQSPWAWLLWLLLFPRSWGFAQVVRLVLTPSTLQTWKVSPLWIHTQKADLGPTPSLIKALTHKTILPFNIFERILCFSIAKPAFFLPRTFPLYPHHTCSHAHTHTHNHTLSSVVAWCEGWSIIIHSGLGKISQNQTEGLGLSQ